MTSTTSTHSEPPGVEVAAVGQWADTPVITINLAGGAIDRSIIRHLAKVLADHHGTHWLHLIAHKAANSERYVDRTLAACRTRDVLAPELTLDAAHALHEALGEALTIAETVCRRDGCDAVGLLDGWCAAHDDALTVVHYTGHGLANTYRADVRRHA